MAYRGQILKRSIQNNVSSDTRRSEAKNRPLFVGDVISKQRKWESTSAVESL
jgi:hypothetical protein